MVPLFFTTFSPSTPRCDGDRKPGDEGYPYVVTWHVWDHAEGMGFASRTEAENCFKEYRDKVSDYATRLYDADMKVLEQYGSMDFYDWDELRAWAEEFFTGGGDARTVGSVSSLVTSATARASRATSGTTTCATS